MDESNKNKKTKLKKWHSLQRTISNKIMNAKDYAMKYYKNMRNASLRKNKSTGENSQGNRSLEEHIPGLRRTNSESAIDTSNRFNCSPSCMPFGENYLFRRGKSRLSITEKNTSSASTENEEAINYVEENNPSPRLIIASRPLEDNPRLYLDRLPKGARNLNVSSSFDESTSANPNFDTSSEEISKPLGLNIGSSSKPPLDKIKSLPTHEGNEEIDLILKNRSLKEGNKKLSLDLSEQIGSPLLFEYSKKENVAEPSTEEIPKIKAKNKGDVEQTNPSKVEIPTHGIKNNDKNKKNVNESSSSSSTVRNKVNLFEGINQEAKGRKTEGSDKGDQETYKNTTGGNAQAINLDNENRTLPLPPGMHPANTFRKNAGSSNGVNIGGSIGSPKGRINRYEEIDQRDKDEESESSDESDYTRAIKSDNGNQIIAREFRALTVPSRIHLPQKFRIAGEGSNGETNGENVRSPQSKRTNYLRSTTK
uniref:Uncharacterized protein n=1 Tax=Meloidogyne floridensis TaxID=298350 RepID=A0A915NI81_9BILA